MPTPQSAKGSPKLRRVQKNPARNSRYRTRLANRTDGRPSGGFPFTPDANPSPARRPSRIARSARLAATRQAKADRLYAGCPTR